MTPAAATLLPYRFERAGRHVLVQFVDPRRLDWSAGFFHMALPHPRASDAIVPLDQFLAESASDVPPYLSRTAGIFHVSRCGSTLLAQNVKATGGAIVLSEPPLFRVLSSPVGDEIDASDAMRAVVCALAQWQAWARAQGRTLVVKFSSQMYLRGAELMAAMPGARFLFLHREPLPVFESLLRKTPQYLRRENAPSPPKFSGATGNPVLHAAAEHYLSALDAFSGSRDERLRIVAYSELAARFPEIVEHLLGRCGADSAWDARTNAKAHLPDAAERYQPVPEASLARFAEEHAAILSAADERYRRFLAQLPIVSPRIRQSRA